MYEITNITSLVGTSIVATPSIFVIVPIFVPLTTTLAPVIGTPLSSVTTIITALYCAYTTLPTHKSRNISRDFFIMNQILKVNKLKDTTE